MRNINKVFLLGRLTRDPISKTIESGRKVVTFGLATNKEWTTKNGERKSVVDFHNIASWGKLADICEKYLKKGQPVYIDGYLKTREWETEDGQKMRRTEIVANDVIMLDQKIQKEESIPDEEADVLEAEITEE